MRAITLLAASVILAPAGMAAAGQPDNPGKFGRDRATIIDTFRAGGAKDTAPGASEWGKIAAERGSANGEMNRDYRDRHGASPNPANDRGSGND